MKRIVGAVATAIGVAAAVRYYRLGLTLSHYDSRGHLIVARRIIDSITPGWQQIGAVWLPLPHLLNMLPVQIDALYRTGASAVAMSVASFVAAAVAVAWIVAQITESRAAAFAAASVFVLNPNVVYLQATPMSEPLFLGLTTAGVALLIAWCEETAHPASPGRPALPALVLSLACLTRYEAWPVTYTALAAAVWTRWRNGASPATAATSVARIAISPTAAIFAFALFSRVVVGHWFVSSDFFVPENKAQGMPFVAIDEIVWGTRELSGHILIALGIVGCTALLIAGLFVRKHAAALIALSLAATAVVPWAAFIDGHPFRIRYMVPLIAMEAVATGMLVGLIVHLKVNTAGTTDTAETLVSAFRRTAPIVLIVIAAYELHPFDLHAPMVVEAQWDAVNRSPRRQVTLCLKSRYHGESIMASMGSLGHYMQEASLDGFNLRDFLHEGNGDIWLAALEEPTSFAGWMMIEEKAEGGDMLYKRAREHPEFLRGYSRVCEGAGLALYERQKRTLNVNR